MDRIKLIVTMLAVLTLTACAQIEVQNKEYPLNINTQLIGDRIVVRVNSSTKGPIKQAQVQVIDEDTNRVIIDKPLNNKGILRFRIPALATRLTVIVIDSDGDKGKRLLASDDLINSDMGIGGQ